MSVREKGAKKNPKQRTFIWLFLVHAHVSYLATLSAAANMAAKLFNTVSAAKQALRTRVAFYGIDRSSNVKVKAIYRKLHIDITINVTAANLAGVR